MHEISLVRSIFRTLETEFPPEKLAQIQTIHLKVGDLSNVEPILLQNAFQALIEDEAKYEGIHLELERVPTEIFCGACQKNSLVKNYVFKCESCGQPSRDIQKGMELLIHRVDFHSELMSESN